MGACGYVTLRRLHDVPLRRTWVFHLRHPGDILIECRCYVIVAHIHDILIKRRGDVLLRRSVKVPLRRRWVFHLRRI